MNNTENTQTNKKSMITGALLGSVITAISVSAIMYTFFMQSNGDGVSENDETKPLYWVAPMDPNYKRDKPGKSPMGMDLIPVYAEDSQGTDAGPGAIKISPEVVNNLGVKTGKVEQRILSNEIKTVGYVKYNEDLLVHLHPRVDGWIDKLFIKAEGDPIEKGQPVYEIYSPALVNAQEEYLLALDRNNQRLIRASEERLKALQIPQAFVEKLKKTRRVSQNVTFYSPQSGVVDNLKIRQGFFVKPGNTLMSIGALDKVWVEAEIFERQVPWVSIGMPVTMTLDYLPGKAWKGQVDYIYPTLDSKTRTVKVRLAFDNTDHLLKPNMFAQVSMMAENKEASLVIPRQALIRTGKQDRVVLALEEGRFKSVEVKVGAQSQEHVEILEGLNEGEKIVTSAQFLIDSESSKSSDFKRMMPNQQKPEAVWTSAVIHSVDFTNRKINATHEAIGEWNWPEMTMDFDVAESVDIEKLSANLSLHMQITEEESYQFSVTGIHIMGSEQEGHDGHLMADTNGKDDALPSATVSGLVNAINSDSRTLNISRGAIEKWDRPPATLDFKLAEDLEMNEIKVGDTIEFTFEVGDDFVIVDWNVADKKDADHSAHNQH